jgi:predicted RNA methylase
MTIIRTSNKPIGQRNRESLGQFFTPSHVADFMASWVDPLPERMTLLDAGAGTGTLIAALVRRICRMPGVTRQLRVTAFEIDPSLAQPLAVCMASCQRMCESSGISFSADIRQVDFIATAAPIARGDLFAELLPPFNVALVNPPYRKIRSDSAERLFLRSAGKEGVVIYIGDAGGAYIDKDYANCLGMTIETSQKISDVLVYDPGRDWLFVIEAVTSSGPIDGKRRKELKDLLKGCKASLIFVTAFENRKKMRRFLDQISWDTEVWVASDPDHLIHFDGERFLMPYPDTNPDNS